MSIVEVANVAGVSKSTVSRVINCAPGVAPGVVQNVRRAMERIGYQPSACRPGRRPASRQGIRTGAIALVAMGHTDTARLYQLPVFPSLLHGVERAVAEHGMSLTLAGLHPNSPLPAALCGDRVDGLLLLGKWEGMPESVRARFRQSPSVWIMRENSDERCEFDHVFYNNAAVGRMAARYLADQGHAHVAFLNTMATHPAFVQRQKDFLAELAVVGISGEAFVGGGNDDFRTCQSLVDRMLRESPPPTGLFVASDSQLPNLCHALELRGVAAGEAIQIISCDNERQFISKLSNPPATIDINLELVGGRGVHQLLWRMRHPQEKNRITVLIEPELVLPNGAEHQPNLRGLVAPIAGATGTAREGPSGSECFNPQARGECDESVQFSQE
jgi:LacI family transcriptional regulator